MSVFEIDQKGQQTLADEARMYQINAYQIEPATFAFISVIKQLCAKAFGATAKFFLRNLS